MVLRAVSGAKVCGFEDGFAFHGGAGVADGDALIQVLLQEWLEAAEAFVLGSMDKFVEDQGTVCPAIGADENSVSDGQARGVRGDKAGGFGGGAKQRVLGHGDAGDFEEADSFWMSDADFFGVGDFDGREGDAFAENNSLLFLGPGGGQRNQ